MLCFEAASVIMRENGLGDELQLEYNKLRQGSLLQKKLQNRVDGVLAVVINIHMRCPNMYIILRKYNESTG